MKKVILSALMVAGLTLASCGSNKTEGDMSTATDTVATTETVTTTTDTVSAMTDTTATSTDTVTPTP